MPVGLSGEIAGEFCVIGLPWGNCSWLGLAQNIPPAATGDSMAVAILQCRLRLAAFRLGKAAAARKNTARWQPRRIGWLAFQRYGVAPLGAVEPRHRG